MLSDGVSARRRARPAAAAARGTSCDRLNRMEGKEKRVNKTIGSERINTELFRGVGCRIAGRGAVISLSRLDAPAESAESEAYLIKSVPILPGFPRDLFSPRL